MSDVPFEFFSFLVSHWIVEATQTNSKTKHYNH
jgi:uncharacterized membrane protein YjdF